MGQMSLRAPPPTHTGAILVSPLALAGRVGTGSLSFEQDCRLYPPNSTQSSLLSCFCQELVKNNHDNNHFHRERCDLQSGPQALCILPEADPTAPRRHHLIRMTCGAPAPAVLLVPHSASDSQGCRGRGRRLLQPLGSASPFQLGVPLRPETQPQCQPPSNDFLPKLPASLSCLPAELAGSLPPTPRGQELLESRDHI